MNFTTTLVIFLSVSSIISCAKKEKKKPTEQATIYRSFHSSVVQNAAKKAEQKGVPQLIHVTAAWCGPCKDIDKSFKTQSEKFKTLQDKVEYTKLEQTHWSDRFNMVDFLPGQSAIYFPSFYIYEPNTKKWRLLKTYDENANTQTILDEVTNHIEQPALARERDLAITAKFLNEESKENTSDDFREFRMALLRLAIEEPKVATDLIRKVFQKIKDGSLKAASVSSDLVAIASILSTEGHLEEHELDNISPLEMKSYQIWYQRWLKFEARLNRIIKNNGRKTAAKQCEDIRKQWSTSATELLQKINSRRDEEQQLKNSEVTLRDKEAKKICQRLGIQSGILPVPEVKKSFNALSDEDKSKESMDQAFNLALAGLYSEALPFTERGIKKYQGEMSKLTEEITLMETQISELEQKIAESGKDKQKVLKQELEKLTAKRDGTVSSFEVYERRKLAMQELNRAWAQGKIAP